MMGTVAGGVSFPVIFFDGERETDIGNVIIYPSLTFKRFVSILSQRIGIYPHQISVFLSDRRQARPGKIPITNKVNFGAFVEDEDFFFYAVLKRSRSVRRRVGRKEFPGYGYGPDPKLNPAADLALLRRNDGGRTFPVRFPPVGYENRFWMLESERQRYLLSMAGVDAKTRPACGGARGGLFVCEECLAAGKMGREAEFHLCVNDAVVVGFRTLAGPIARPGRRTGFNR